MDIIWGTANKTRLNPLKVCQNKILRIILPRNICTPVSKLYEALHFLNLDSIYELELAIYMHKVNHLKLPEFFYESFTKIETVYLHKSFEYFLPRVNKKFSQNLLAFRGA